jgi:hypothetical protein
MNLRKWTMLTAVGISGGLMMSLSGCVKIQNQAVTLGLKVASAGRPGVYTVSGTTTLPDRTPVIIQGVRYLKQRGDTAQDPADYSILARQTTRAQGGQWSATLNLLQPGPNGVQQEAWQFSAREAKQLDAAPDVIFTATTPPTYPTQNTEQQLDTRNRRPDQGAVVYTNDGEWYLLAQQPLPIPLPEGIASSAKADINDIARVWGSNGNLDNSEPSSTLAPINLKEPTNTAPLSNDAIAR